MKGPSKADLHRLPDSLEGEDVCVFVGPGTEERLPFYGAKIVENVAGFIFVLFDSSVASACQKAETFAQTMAEYLAQVGAKCRFFVLAHKDWECFHAQHKNECFGIFHLQGDERMPVPSSANRVFPMHSRAAEKLADFDDTEETKNRLLQVVELFAGEKPGGMWPVVLLLGETGAGKTFAARKIYEALSAVQDIRGKFLHLNCGEFGAEDMNAALFGVSKGQFTGVAEHAGAIEEAGDGIVFLDEIGTLPLELQPRLLTVLDKGEYRRHGEAGNTKKAACRFVFGTNEDLAKAVLEKRFRFDLYNRVTGVKVFIPSVAERIGGKNGVKFLEMIEREMCRIAGGLRLTRNAQRMFVAMAEKHSWRGNFRELARFFQLLRLEAMTSGRRGVVSASAMRDALISFSRSEAPDEGAFSANENSASRFEMSAHDLPGIGANEKVVLQFAFTVAAEARNCTEAGRRFFEGKHLQNPGSSFARHLERYGFKWDAGAPGHVAREEAQTRHEMAKG